MFVRSSVDSIWWYDHQTFQANLNWHQLIGLVKVPPNWINWGLCKHCFKNEWTLALDLIIFCYEKSWLAFNWVFNTDTDKSGSPKLRVPSQVQTPRAKLWYSVLFGITKWTISPFRNPCLQNAAAHSLESLIKLAKLLDFCPQLEVFPSRLNDPWIKQS